MDSLHRLEEIFSHFPGIGPRQAKRFIYYLLSKPPASVEELTRLLLEVKKTVFECEYCHRFFVNNSVKSVKKDQRVCDLCSDSSRDHTTLMIVARDSDLETIEKSGAYHGLYFILGGTIPLLEKEPNKKIRLNDMIKYIKAKKDLKEIILSLNTTPEGEYTADVIKNAVKDIQNNSLKITILGRGLSTGAELEYVDSETIKNALGNRK